MCKQFFQLYLQASMVDPLVTSWCLVYLHRDQTHALLQKQKGNGRREKEKEEIIKTKPAWWKSQALSERELQISLSKHFLFLSGTIYTCMNIHLCTRTYEKWYLQKNFCTADASVTQKTLSKLVFSGFLQRIQFVGEVCVFH